MPSLDRWETDLQDMASSSTLNMSLFGGGNEQSRLLSLPVPPVFVNTLEKFLEMQTALKHKSILSIDTEWYDVVGEDKKRASVGNDDGDSDCAPVRLSTIQISALTIFENHRTNNIDNRFSKAKCKPNIIEGTAERCVWVLH